MTHPDILRMTGPVDTARRVDELNRLLMQLSTHMQEGDEGLLPAVDPGPTKFWNDISFNFSSARTVGVGVPTWTDINSTGRRGWAMTHNEVLANEKILDWGVQAGHGVVVEGPLRFHVHFYTGARVPLVDEFIRVELKYCITPIGSVLTTTTTTATIKIPKGTPSYTHLAGRDGSWNLETTIVTPSADLGGTMRRKCSEAADTYEDTVYFIYADPHAQFDRAGTITEFGDSE